MEANEAPEKIYIPRLINDGKLIHEWDNVPFKNFRFFFDKEIAENIEYTRTDAFIEKACVKLKKLMYDNLMFQGRLHREEVIDNFVEDFKKYMKGE